MEALAYDYLRLEAVESYLLIYAAAWAGFPIGYRLTPERVRYGRGSYFFFIVATTLGVQLQQFVWVDWPAAFYGGRLWALMASDLLAGALAGVAVAHLSVGRALQGFGDKQKAILGMVPGVNFILLFKPPNAPGAETSPAQSGHDDHAVARAPSAPLETADLGGPGSAGIFLGVVTIALILVAQRSLEERMTAVMEASGNETIALDLLFRTEGTQQALEQLADLMFAPVYVEEKLFLFRVDAGDMSLSRIYGVERPRFPEAVWFQPRAVQKICQDPLLRALIDRGVVVHEDYQSTLSDDRLQFTVAAAECAAWPPPGRAAQEATPPPS